MDFQDLLAPGARVFLTPEDGAEVYLGEVVSDEQRKRKQRRRDRYQRAQFARSLQNVPRRRIRCSGRIRRFASHSAFVRALVDQFHEAAAAATFAGSALVDLSGSVELVVGQTRESRDAIKMLFFGDGRSDDG